MAKGETLKRYLFVRLILVALILSGIFVIIITKAYEKGLDESTEFYLFEDAQHGIALFNKTGELPNSTIIKQFYLSTSTLPEFVNVVELQEKLKSGSAYFNKVIGEQFIYGLALPMVSPINASATDAPSFMLVIHQFNLLDDANAPGIKINQVTFVSVLLAIGIMGLVSLWIYGVVIRSVDALAEIDSGDETKSKEKEHVNDVLRFDEFVQVAERLQSALDERSELVKKEKHFVSSLSHELRTPMAVVSAALDILDEQAIPTGVKNKLLAIRQANNNMKDLAQTLLMVWQRETHMEPAVELNLHNFLYEQIEQITTGLSEQPSRVHLSVAEDLVVKVRPQVLSIVMMNVLRNGLLHGLGPIEVIFKSGSEDGLGQLMIRNEVETNGGQNSHSEGSGLGLYIAEQAALSQNWQLSHFCSNREFSVCLKLRHSLSATSDLKPSI